MESMPSVELYQAGQGPWLDTISRRLLRSGQLKKWIEKDGLLGVTSNPSIFQQAISQGDGYEQDIRKLLRKGATTLDVYDALTIADITETCDLFLPVFERTKGEHGFVSLEVLPCLAANTEATVREAKRLFDEVRRPNLMIKVPATPEGIVAVEELVAEGINVNVTLIFSQANYIAVAQAYLAGLARLAGKGGTLAKVHSVASVFVSRIDTDIDKQLDGKIATERDSAKRMTLEALKGKAAVANTKMVYQEFKRIFSSDAFRSLKDRGANIQKVLWGSTSTKNPSYADLVYVENLVGKDSVNTLPQATWEALLDHGQIRPDAIEENIDEARGTVERLRAVGIDVHSVCDRLQKDGVRSFVSAFESLMAVLENKNLDSIRSAGTVKISYTLPEHIKKTVASAVRELTQKNLHGRWLAKDPTIWTNDPAHHKVILNRLGWVEIAEKIPGRLYEVDLLREKVFAEKVRDIVLLGMGGSSLAAEVMSLILSKPSHRCAGAPKMRFHLLDTTDPLSIAKVDRAVNYASTIFVVGSKSGSTIETRSQYQFFFDAVKKAFRGDAKKAANRFVFVTDDGSPFAALGRSLNLAGLFLNPSDIGGRYSALSFFGLVPAALLGIDIRKIVKDAQSVLANMREAKDLTKNLGIQLGIILGTLALQGKDKLTFLTSPSLASFADWAEQLIAESTGKEGKGIIPIAGEPLLPYEHYGANRVFAILRQKGENGKLWTSRIRKLRLKGFPVIDCVWADGMNVGGEFLKWEIATSIAGVLLRINPYDEPNVKESKDITGTILSAMQKKMPLSRSRMAISVKSAALTPADKKTLGAFFEKLDKDGYLSLLAYVDRTAATKKELQTLQKTIASGWKVPALSGFGPRYLHSIGQLYKGGPKQGSFIEFTAKDRIDLKVPGEKYGFSQLKKAQAMGDYEATSNKGLPVLVVDLGTDVLEGLRSFRSKLKAYLKTLS
ncbi:MAG: Transaldolase [Candidatus Omnitrophica bacterium ADurb.Bin314]|nr:MAG: Transaldolase [Candidatus Omnitrophica bacterium ADurb.Bin314]